MRRSASDNLARNDGCVEISGGGPGERSFAETETGEIEGD